MFDNGRGMTVKGTTRGGAKESWSGGCFVSFPAFAWSRSPVYTGRTKLALFIRRWPENGWETAGSGNVSFQLANFHLFALFFYFGQQTPPPRLPLRRFVNTCLFADLFDLRVDDDTTQKLDEK